MEAHFRGTKYFTEAVVHMSNLGENCHHKMDHIETNYLGAKAVRKSFIGKLCVYIC